MRNKLAAFAICLVLFSILASSANAGCGCSSGSNAWSGDAWLQSTTETSNDIVVEDIPTENNSELETTNVLEIPLPTTITTEELFQELDGGSTHVLIYVNNVPRESYIEGTVLLPSKNLVYDDSTIKSVPDLAGMLGSAGISENDPLVIYGDCFPCGDLTFVFWIMKSLGHKDVRLLKGTEDDWGEVKMDMIEIQNARSATSYVPEPNAAILADYDLVLSGDLQIVDARSADQFAQDHIVGAINIEYDQVIEDGWIKGGEDLSEIFIELEKGKPVVVYSKRGGQASIVWYDLREMGYDARPYTWDDWLAHRE